MTIFGPDISSYQSGLVLARLSDASFVIAKATEGTGYTDADFATFRAQTAALNRLFVWYHFLSGAAAAAQAAHTAAVVGSTLQPGMLDAEPTQTFRPTLAQIYAYIDAAHAAKLNLRLCYLPRWYWEELGEPDLSGLADRGVHLVASQYPGGTGNPERLYPGDGAAGWGEYGGLYPLIYQYTDKASDGGQALDYNAYRGTTAALAAALDVTNTTNTGGSAMGNIPASIATKWPDIAGDFPPNAPYTDATALIWSDAGARAAALYAREARDAINALAQRIGSMPTADQIGTAVAAHLTGGGGASATDIAAAVAHLFAQKLNT